MIMSEKPAIPILNLQEQYEQLAPELEQAVIAVLRSGRYILGEHGVRLEAEIAALSGCKHGIGVANCTDALNLALWSLNISPDDEVITTPFTFAATVEAVLLRGAKPVFVDVDEETYNIDTRLIESKITPRTKAIMPVHLFGLPADMDPIIKLANSYSLKIIEDNAQAIGATYKGRPTGSLSDVACISFYPTKNLGACGDAGMLVTNDDALAERLKVLRAHGMRKRYYHDELGINSRLDEVQAAVLLSKLPHLKNWNAGRQKIARLYDKALNQCPNVTIPKAPPYYGETGLIEHVWHQYTVRIGNRQSESIAFGTARDAVMAELSKRGIGSMCYYPVPLHRQSAFLHLGYGLGDFPIAEKLARQVLSLPMYPELRQDQINYIAASLADIVSQLDVPLVSQPSQAPTILAT
jgi:dTDP-4-amino-4,6-dideoxygalactose transaminase